MLCSYCVKRNEELESNIKGYMLKHEVRSLFASFNDCTGEFIVFAGSDFMTDEKSSCGGGDEVCFDE